MLPAGMDASVIAVLSTYFVTAVCTQDSVMLHCSMQYDSSDAWQLHAQTSGK